MIGWWVLVLVLAANVGAQLQSHDFWRAGMFGFILACAFIARDEFTKGGTK